MGHFLYHPKSFRTARELARLLRIPFNRNIDQIKRKRSYPVIRYGCSHGEFYKDTNINSPEIIRLCANSYWFGRWAKDNEFNVPYYSRFDWNNLPEYPFLLRNLYHMAGRDIIIIKSEQDLMRIRRNILAQRYVVDFVPTSSELRVHVINSKIVRIFKKVKPGHIERGEMIRTSRHGFHYSLRLDETLNNKYQKAQELAVNISSKLGLFFGGIDMAWNKEKKEYIIWEINTAPGLNPNTMRIYANELREYI